MSSITKLMWNPNSARQPAIRGDEFGKPTPPSPQKPSAKQVSIMLTPSMSGAKTTMPYSNKAANPNSLDSLHQYLQDPSRSIINITKRLGNVARNQKVIGVINITKPLVNVARNQEVIEVPANKTLKIEAGGSLGGIVRLRPGSELLVGQNGVFNGRVVVENDAHFRVQDGGTFLAAYKGYHTEPRRHGLEVHHGGSVHIEPNALIGPMTVYGNGMLNGQRLVEEHRLLIGPNQTLSKLTDPVIAFPRSTIAGTTLTSESPLYVTPLRQVTAISRMKDGLAIFPVDKAPDPNKLRERIQNNGERIDPQDTKVYQQMHYVEITKEPNPNALDESVMILPKEAETRELASRSRPAPQTIDVTYTPPKGRLVVGKDETLHIPSQGVLTGDVHLGDNTELVVDGTVTGSVTGSRSQHVHITSTGRVIGDVTIEERGLLRIDEGGAVEGDVVVGEDDASYLHSYVFVDGSVGGRANVGKYTHVAIGDKGQVGKLESTLPHEIRFFHSSESLRAMRHRFLESAVPNLIFKGGRVDRTSSSLYAEAGAQIGSGGKERYSVSNNFDAIVIGSPYDELDPATRKFNFFRGVDAPGQWRRIEVRNAFVQDIKNLFGDEHAYVIHPMLSE